MTRINFPRRPTETDEGPTAFRTHYVSDGGNYRLTCSKAKYDGKEHWYASVQSRANAISRWSMISRHRTQAAAERACASHRANKLRSIQER